MSTTGIIRVGVLTVGLAAASGCFTTTADYREDAETYIVESDTIAEGLGVTIATATCDEPVDQEPGTTFDCTAVDSDGATWGFEVEIDEDNEFEVRVSERP